MIFLTASNLSFAQCTSLGGSAFLDFNNNGAQDAGEIGQSGITVEVYESNGSNPVGTATTNNNGDWDINDSGITYPIRVEFVVPPSLSYLSPTAFGANQSTDVQTLTVGSCNTDFAISNPADYCQPNPLVFASCFVSGNHPGLTQSQAAGSGI